MIRHLLCNFTYQIIDERLSQLIQNKNTFKEILPVFFKKAHWFNRSTDPLYGEVIGIIRNHTSPKS